MTPNSNIESMSPRKRKCYFHNEYPESQPLTAHQNYSQVSCILECNMRKVLSKRMEGDKCIPWYFPPVDKDIRLCSPFEARDFKKEMESIAAEECKVICIKKKCVLYKFFNDFTFICEQDCLPNCEETRYTATVSASPFRQCDFRTVGINPLCDLAMDKDAGTSFATVYPQMWAQSAMEQYEYFAFV